MNLVCLSSGASKWVGCKREDFELRHFRLLFSPRKPKAVPVAPTFFAPHLKPLINDPAFSDVCFVLDDSEDSLDETSLDSNTNLGCSRVYAIRGLLGIVYLFCRLFVAFLFLPNANVCDDCVHSQSQWRDPSISKVYLVSRMAWRRHISEKFVSIPFHPVRSCWCWSICTVAWSRLKVIKRFVFTAISILTIKNEC